MVKHQTATLRPIFSNFESIGLDSQDDLHELIETSDTEYFAKVNR